MNQQQMIAERLTIKQRATLLKFGLSAQEADALSKDQAGVRIRVLLNKKYNGMWTEQMWCPACGKLHEIHHVYPYQYVRDNRMNRGIL